LVVASIINLFIAKIFLVCVFQHWTEQLVLKKKYGIETLHKPCIITQLQYILV